MSKGCDTCLRKLNVAAVTEIKDIPVCYACWREWQLACGIFESWPAKELRPIFLHLRENVRVYSASAVVSRATLMGDMGRTVQQTLLKVKMAVLWDLCRTGVWKGKKEVWLTFVARIRRGEFEVVENSHLYYMIFCMKWVAQ